MRVIMYKIDLDAYEIKLGENNWIGASTESNVHVSGACVFNRIKIS